MFASISFLNVLSSRTIQRASITGSVAYYSAEKKIDTIPDIDHRSIVWKAFYSETEQAKTLSRIDQIADSIIKQIECASKNPFSSQHYKISWEELFFFKPIFEAHGIPYKYTFAQQISSSGDLYICSPTNRFSPTKRPKTAHETADQHHQWLDKLDMRIQDAYMLLSQEPKLLDNESNESRTYGYGLFI